jgi:hypothetical protein
MPSFWSSYEAKSARDVLITRRWVATYSGKGEVEETSLKVHALLEREFERCPRRSYVSFSKEMDTLQLGKNRL